VIGMADYARHWLRREALPIGHPNWMTLNRVWVREVEDARPGFSEQLRNTALASLATDDETLVRNAIAILAIVGTAEDVPTLKEITEDSGAQLHSDARTAIYEIEHRSSEQFR